MMNVDPDDLLGKAYDARIVRRLLAFVQPDQRRAIGAVLLIAVVTACELLIPKLFSMGVDEVASDRRKWVLNVLGGAFMATLLVRFVASWGQYYLTAWLGNRIVFDLRNTMFRHLQTLSIGYIDRRGVGRIMTRIQNDVSVIQEFLGDGAVGIVSNVLVLIGIVVFMFVTNWQMALLTLIVLPIMIAITARWRVRAVETYRETRRTMSIVNGNLAESIAGVRVSQAYVREPQNIRHFDRLNRENLDASIEAAKLSSLLFPTVNLIGATATALVLYIGGRLAFDLRLSIGELVLFIALIDRFFEPIRDLRQQYTVLQATMAAGERIFEVLDVQAEVKDTSASYPLPPIVGKVDFNRLTFGYGKNEILHDID
ncbi:MAG: ATP-binding cassette, subfamily multidrug efflux pump, partial [Thermomicrobiales bacterium]|nr:ATP-binding cassette, subfamily multidrug efflux pump [Thermomicrobiales bacterium]